MAQHRTKQDKIKASISRVENSKLYSLSYIDSSKNTVSSRSILKTDTPSTPVALNMKTVSIDLKRTGISLAIVLGLLAIGFYYLG